MAATLDAGQSIPALEVGRRQLASAHDERLNHPADPRIDAPDLPATLSRRITTDVLRGAAGFGGLAVTDDMEMHAVSDLGTYESITDRVVRVRSLSVTEFESTEYSPTLAPGAIRQ